MADGKPRRLLFISNGYGEDSIAAAIIRRLPPGLIAEAYATIGSGSAFRDVCQVVGPRAQLQSEGWRNVRFSLAKDLSSGGLNTLWPGLQFLRRVRDHYSDVVVVGDLVGVFGCWATGIRGITYLDVYKTGAGRLYSGLEKRMIGATAARAFCRAQNLADQLRTVGVDARCAGNLMLDTVPFGEYNPQSRRAHERAITLLPGSRKLTVDSFAIQVEAIRRLPAEAVPDLFAAIAPSVDIDELARAAGLRRSGPLSSEAGDLGTLSDRKLTIHLSQGALGNLIAVSDLVLSQAGTATVQAIGSGVPAITFRNARDRSSRFRDETALFGEGRVVTSPDADEIGKALLHLLTDERERLHRAAAGRSRIGGSGAMDAVLSALMARNPAPGVRPAAALH